MIVKLQRNLTPGPFRVLIYNIDRSLFFEGTAGADIEAAFAGRAKIYCEAELVDGELLIGNEVPAQPW